MNDEPTNSGDDEAEDPWASALAEQADAEAETSTDADPATEDEENTASQSDPLIDSNAAKAPLQDFSNAAGEPEAVDEVRPNLDVVLDIPVTITMEVGRTEISIRNLLQLNQGSVVELDRLAGEPLDVMINGTIVAHGEVVVVNDKYGIRMTDVVSPADRIKRIN